MIGKYNYGTGRRKNAVARVFIKPGKGDITVNGKPLDVFFSRETGRMIVRQPLELTQHAQTFDIRVNVFGGTGYTGVELLRLLAAHPEVELAAITSRAEAGVRVADHFPSLRGRVDLAFTDPAKAPLKGCDCVFFATPNGVAMAQVKPLLEAGTRVIDFSADFRLKDRTVWEKWYKVPHAAPELLFEAVYGLPELNRDRIR